MTAHKSPSRSRPVPGDEIIDTIRPTAAVNMRNALALAALFRATSGLHSVAVRSNNAYSCDPINGIHIAFSEDRNKVSASLAAKVDMRVAHLTNYYPIKYPLVFDYAASALLDLDVNPGIGNDSYQGEFEYFANNPNLEWSTCFNGYLANTTSLDFALSGRTEKRGTSAPDMAVA
ncbi:hypothetical protein DL764_005779 [Monosporascus ibericus]|uniref:Uncharacterized protein n=1 Tax=Monosporascus ibericus TaxID=155417 RepID=A0A4Q4T7Q8_9PEZI|nr:hypothetical protein DL764_005779 [Monosporascus ibericus]